MNCICTAVESAFDQGVLPVWRFVLVERLIGARSRCRDSVLGSNRGPAGGDHSGALCHRIQEASASQGSAGSARRGRDFSLFHDAETTA